MRATVLPRRFRACAAPLCALAVFALALAATFHEVWRHGPTRFVASLPRAGAFATTTRSDQRFVAWGAGRNAWTLLHRPWDLFDAEPCFPARDSLAFGEPMLAQGILGLPARLVTSDPVATYNVSVSAGALLAAMAMYLLVAEWTGVAAAGIAAGLLYAFGGVARQHVIHPYVADTSWTVLALFFARRFLAGGRWRDAAGAGLSTAMQLGASFYPTIAALFLSIPVAAWMLLREGIRRVRPGPMLVALSLPLLAAALVYGPYLELREVEDLSRETGILYLEPSRLAGEEFPGWPAVALALAAFALGRRRACSARVGDPRLALALGAALVAWAALGPNAAFLRPFPLPDLYAATSAILPGLDAVRVPLRIVSGVHLAVCALAGFGAAALLRLAPRRVSALVAAALVAIAFVDAVRPRGLGLPDRAPVRPLEIAPDPEEIEFFLRLGELHDEGPLLEVPAVRAQFLRQATSVLLTAYHHRRTSACYNSFQPAALGDIEDTSARLPRREAVRAARELGFTSIVVHHAKRTPVLDRLRERFERASERRRGGLRLLLRDEHHSAYAIEPARPPGVRAGRPRPGPPR